MIFVAYVAYDLNNNTPLDGMRQEFAGIEYDFTVPNTFNAFLSWFELAKDLTRANHYQST